ISTRQPYREWVEANRIRLNDIECQEPVQVGLSEEKLHEMQLAFGYTREDIEHIIIPMIVEHKEPVSSMGNDMPLAVFSDLPQRLFNYFRQLFAQVTNPAIDPLREKLVMTLTSYIGGEENLLDESEEHCRMIQYTRPIFSNTDIHKISAWKNDVFNTATLDITFPVSEGTAGLEKALVRLWNEAQQKVSEGYSFLILSDRKVSAERVPIPSLLACSSVHHHLIRSDLRTKTGIVIETAEAREVMHFALLFGYGASAVNPYGVFATIHHLFKKGVLTGANHYLEAEDIYIESIEKGLLKILSKLGISTLRSYRGAQTFEALGLSKEMVDKHFTGTASRIDGIGLEEIAQEALMQHRIAFEERPSMLESTGFYYYRKGGEQHAWNPESIHLMQWAVRNGDYEKYKKFAAYVNKFNQRPHFIRGFFEFKKGTTPVPIEEV
ncbi:MAG TPA: glutamate synthase central domain-containing protein, partial [Aggregatilineales bacterium]|nr:glutamate synthase central domain-containing protein [Aggregatilineales bacterium]